MLLVVLALASGGVVAGCAASSAERVPSASPSPLDEDPFVRSFRALRPTVVLFTMNVPSDDKRRKGAFDEAYGSGVVVASGAWGSQVLTAEHVIHDSSHLRATLDDSHVVPARVTAADEKADLALVQIAVPNRPIATLGSSARIEPGTAVGLAGYPSVRDDALELDLPVIPGESGGPIFVANTGVVIGLAESRFDDEKAIGFAVPIEDAEHFLRGKLR
jgi:S1-C subfamily serine protease